MSSTLAVGKQPTSQPTHSMEIGLWAALVKKKLHSLTLLKEPQKIWLNVPLARKDRGREAPEEKAIGLQTKVAALTFILLHSYYGPS